MSAKCGQDLDESNRPKVSIMVLTVPYLGCAEKSRLETRQDTNSQAKNSTRDIEGFHAKPRAKPRAKPKDFTVVAVRILRGQTRIDVCSHCMHATQRPGETRTASFGASAPMDPLVFVRYMFPVRFQRFSRSLLDPNFYAQRLAYTLQMVACKIIHNRMHNHS